MVYRTFIIISNNFWCKYVWTTIPNTIKHSFVCRYKVLRNGIIIHSLIAWFVHNCRLLCHLPRTPFEVDTTARCASLVISQVVFFACAMITFYSLISIFIELKMYTASLLLDIVTTFVQMHRLSKVENREQSMLEDCKDAVILHDRINRYLLRGQIRWKIRFYQLFWRFRCMSQFAEITNFIVLVIVVSMVVCACNCLFVLENVILCRCPELLLQWIMLWISFIST